MGTDDVGDITVVQPPKLGSAPDPARNTKHLLGVPGATALIIGGVIGTGVFSMPGQIAKYGMLAIVGLLLATVGAIGVGLLFSKLSSVIPRAGGPYAYPDEVFGSFAGFTAAWSYWMTTAIGNAGIVVSWVLYVNVVFGWSTTNPIRDFGIAVVGLWLPVAINFIGLDRVKQFQIVTVVIKIMPLVFIGTVGLVVALSRNEFPAWNPSGQTPWVALSAVAAVVLFIFLGVEDASSAAGRVKNPTRNVPRATVLGTLSVSALYVASTIAIFGLVSTTELTGNGTPFATAMDNMTGTSWAGQVMAVFAVISGIGALNGLTLLVAEVPRAAAADGLFPAPFMRITKRDAPWFGLLCSALIATGLVGIASVGKSGLETFGFLVLLTGITSAIPYFLSALVLIYLLTVKRRKIHPGIFARDMLIASVAAVFSIWSIVGSGAKAVELAFMLILGGYVVYAVFLARKKRAEIVQ